MSRLLQALKNLEARTGTPAASPQTTAKPAATGKGVLAHLADKFHSPAPDPPPPPVAPLQRPAKPTPIKERPANNPLAYLSTGVPTIVLEPPPTPEIDFPLGDSFAPVFVNEQLPPVAAPPPLPAYSPPPVVEEPPPPRTSGVLPTTPPVPELEPYEAGVLPATEPVAEPEPPALAVRQPTLIERTVRRTLTDPARSEPFRQLAERLWSDLEPSGSRTVLLTGIGPASETHDVVLHAAALLAERSEVLVVDADAAHRTLTCQLDLPDARGLVEAVESDANVLQLIQATTLADLRVLPFGKARLRDPVAAANRLAAALQTLEGDYRLVLIDGGRSSELTAATLARLCDATYFVIRLGETEAALAQSAVRDFRAAGARVLGCIATST